MNLHLTHAKARSVVVSMLEIQRHGLEAGITERVKQVCGKKYEYMKNFSGQRRTIK
jgi:hypothetical protein